MEMQLMNLQKFEGLLRNSVILVQRLMETNPDFYKSLSNGEAHNYLYNQVDNYLKENGIKADRKTINVLTDMGKERFIYHVVQPTRVNHNMEVAE